MPSISDIKIWPVNGNKVILANGSLTVENAVNFKFSVIKGPKGPFVGFPGKFGEKDGKKTFYADVKVIDETFNKQLTATIMQAYNNKVGNSLNQGASPEPVAQDDGDIPF